MNTLRLLVIVAALASASCPAFAQPAAAPNPPPARGEDAAGSGAAKTRQACRQEAAAKGLRGPNAKDHVQVCVLEARLGCLKQAIGQKIRGSARKDFIKKCLDGGA